MAKTATTKATRAAPSKPARNAPTPSRNAPARPQRQQEPEEDEPRRASVPATAKDGGSASLPAHMRQDAGMGKEGIKNEDIEIPRLKLMQGLSPELQQFNDLKAGMFFHSASEDMFDGSVRIVPIYYDLRYILWNPRESGGGILARADDGVHWSPSSGSFDVKLDKKDGGHKVNWKLAKTVDQSGLAAWGTMNPNDPDSPPAATKMYNFVVAFPDHPDLMPAALTFQRSSVKAGRKFLTKLKTVRTPLFGSIFNLSSVVDSNSANQDFYNMSLAGDGLVEDETLYNQYRDLHLSFKNTGFNVRDLEGMQDEGGDNADDEENSGGNGGSRKY